MVELRDVAGELLAQRERCRILQVGAADLDDVVECLRLLRERVAQRLERWHQTLLHRGDCGNVHGGGEHVVRRLPAVDVIVRVDQALHPALAAEQFRGAVGEHLVDVHVGLRAGAGLPHDQREFGVVLAGDHFVRRLCDRLAGLAVDLVQFDIDQRAGALDPRERADELHRHALAGNAEVLQAALRLRAPQPVRRHLHLTQTVPLDPGGCHVDLPENISPQRR